MVTLAALLALSTACGGDDGGAAAPSADDEAKTYADVGDATERAEFLQRDRLPSCGTIEISDPKWTATGDDLAKRDCFFAAVDAGTPAELHLVSWRGDRDADRGSGVEEWVRTFAGGKGETFTLLPSSASDTRWDQDDCNGFGLGSGPITPSKEYPGCTP